MTMYDRVSRTNTDGAMLILDANMMDKFYGCRICSGDSAMYALKELS